MEDRRQIPIELIKQAAKSLESSPLIRSPLIRLNVPLAGKKVGTRFSRYCSF